MSTIKSIVIQVIASMIAILAPIHALMFSVGFLIIADLVTGIWASIKLKRKIKSSVMRRSVSKILVYQLAIISGFLVEQYMLDSYLPVSKIVASVIGLVELKSILENANNILGYPLFKSIVSKLGSENDDLKEEIVKKVTKEVKDQLD